MKKLFSILTIVLLLAGSLHFSVAKHYCGGKLAATKITLSGKPASCGMENEEGTCPAEPRTLHLEQHCCENSINHYFIDNNYVPERKVNNQVFSISSQAPEFITCPIVALKYSGNHISANTGPPDILPGMVDITRICIFRI